MVNDRKIVERTQLYYDEFPYIEGGEKRVLWWANYLKKILPTSEIKGKLVADIGSSIGEISKGLVGRGAHVVCLDLSYSSLIRCKKINSEAEILQGNALNTPFPDDSFDHVVSIGVLHHTPDCHRGFKEIVRITAPEGKIVILLYNYWSLYNLLYHAFFPIRWLVPLKVIPSFFLKLLQPLAFFHFGKKINEAQLRNLLGDQLWNPHASFHSVKQVCRWGEEEGLILMGVDKFLWGHSNIFHFKKKGESSHGNS